MKTTCAACALLLFAAMAPAQSERSLLREGNAQYKDGKFPDAEVNYRKALEKNNDLEQGPFNLGNALYRQERFGESAEQFAAAAGKSADAETKAKAYHNMGNALVKSGKIPEGIDAYKQSLRLNPDDDETRYNLALAKRMLQQQQQQQQNQQDKKDQKDQKDEQQNQQNKKDQQQDQQQNQQDKKDQKQDQQQQQQQQQQQEQQEKQAQQAKKQMLSKEDAERMLEALKNEEKNVQKKVQRKVPARVKVEKDW